MVPVLTYFNIDPDVIAFSSTRHGGISKDAYGEFNINPYCGDKYSRVVGNRKLLADGLGLHPAEILLPHQIHGTKNVIIDEKILAYPKELISMSLEGADSLTCDIKGICIGVSTADCIPVLLFDRKKKCSAAIHAGWRGTAKRIVMKTLETMHEHYGTNPMDIVAAIGPGISKKNFEVGFDVYDIFKSAGFDMQAIASSGRRMGYKNKPKKFYIDLPLCNKMQLVESGVAPENILMSGICTYDDYEDYFSARRLGPDSGRIYSGIIIKL